MCGSGGVRADRARHEVFRQGNQEQTHPSQERGGKEGRERESVPERIISVIECPSLFPSHLSSTALQSATYPNEIIPHAISPQCLDCVCVPPSPRTSSPFVQATRVRSSIDLQITSEFSAAPLLTRATV